MAGNPSAGPDAITLLVVEEDEAVRSFLNVALKNKSFEVLLAASGTEALQLFREHADRIRLVLMDVNMEGLDGPETLVQLQQMKPGVTCCFMSGDTSAARWPDLLAIGARKVFTKPFSSIQDLAQALHQIIDESASA